MNGNIECIGCRALIQERVKLRELLEEALFLEKKEIIEMKIMNDWINRVQEILENK